MSLSEVKSGLISVEDIFKLNALLNIQAEAEKNYIEAAKKQNESKRTRHGF